MPKPAGSIVEAFFEHVGRAPEKVCLRFEGEELTYAGLGDLARRWAGGLLGWGLRPGERVALFLENSPTFLGAYLGSHLAGGIVVLVNAQYRQVELRHILSDAQVRLVITDASRRAELARVAAELPDLAAVVTIDRGATRSDRIADLSSADFLRAPPADLRWPDASAGAVIGYTSGTTGRSKGALLSHGNLAANSRAVTTAWEWTADDHLLLALPLFHAHGLFVGMHGTFTVGSSVDLHRRFVAGEIFDSLLRGQASMFFGVPTMYTRLIAEAQSRGARPPPIRLYVSGSAPLSVQAFNDFERLFGQRILERYGMTETSMNLTNPYRGERRPGTVGQPFPGQEARIVDLATREPILDEQPGEIQVRGPHVFGGYWRRPDATAAAFEGEGWFNTGDIGWRSADGYYTISGRARELIISGGYNVYPREVEEVLLTHPDIAEAAVVGLPDPDLGEQVVAAVVRREAAAVTADDLVALCRDQLAAYKKPRAVYFVETLPRNALGKVQKHLLRDALVSPPP
ncbi:MAG TPA: acyl-CoA synthetase [Chloroflexota bacterium]|nr:acyl-CoA synthetase [Chloroflexota bacterium]